MVTLRLIISCRGVYERVGSTCRLRRALHVTDGWRPLLLVFCVTSTLPKHQVTSLWMYIRMQMKKKIQLSQKIKSVKLSDLLRLQKSPANTQDIPESSSREETCQIFDFKSTSDNIHKQLWWLPADDISPLAAGCESFTLSFFFFSSRCFVLIYRGGQKLWNHFHMCDYSHSFRAAVLWGWQRLLWNVGSEVRWRGKKTVCPQQMSGNCRQWLIIQKQNSSRKQTATTSDTCCWSPFSVLLLPSLPCKQEATRRWWGEDVEAVSLHLTHQKLDVCSLWSSPGATDEAQTLTYTVGRVFGEDLSII